MQVVGMAIVKVEPTKRNLGHKGLRPSWDGPYSVTKTGRDGVYELSILKGRKLLKSYHSDDLQPFFA